MKEEIIGDQNSTPSINPKISNASNINESPPTPPKGVKKKGLLSALGPGLVTGASDDDPSGIATYSQVGAQFGFSMLWVLLITYPLMAGIQEISAVIGRVTGHGIAGNIRRYYRHWLVYFIVSLVLVANIINLGADIGAMGAAAAMLIPVPALSMAALFTVISVVLQSIAPYDKYTNILKWMTLSIFAYVLAAFFIKVNWPSALISTVVPSFQLKVGFITAFVAVLGTTISPYLFFWQAGEEVEIEKANPAEDPLKHAPRQAPKQLHRIRVDTYFGMAISNIIAFFIMLTAGATMHTHGITDIQTATQAAQALKPIAGEYAYLVFALGIIGSGLLALPVLAGSAAYAVGEALNWPVGLAREPLQAKGFYIVLAVSMVIGFMLTMLHISPIKALFWSAVINGLVAPPIMIIMMLLSSNKKVMGEFTLNKRQTITGWISTAVMMISAVALLVTLGH